MRIPERILLRDRNERLVDAWLAAFADVPSVSVSETDFFSEPADAVVSPANSFGVMDGGLDLLLRATLDGIEAAVQSIIVAKHHGELPVGVAEVVPTSHPRWPYLVCAPTMRVPENIGRSVNAYLAFRAALLAVARFNASESGPGIRSMLVPGLGTGVGRLDPQRCAAQMRLAYDAVMGSGDIPSFQAIHATHIKLLSG